MYYFGKIFSKHVIELLKKKKKYNSSYIVPS